VKRTRKKPVGAMPWPIAIMLVRNVIAITGPAHREFIPLVYKRKRPNTFGSAFYI
jgi:hypothetical protein